MSIKLPNYSDRIQSTISLLNRLENESPELLEYIATSNMYKDFHNNLNMLLNDPWDGK